MATKDSKTPKVMDVSRPGSSAPPSSAKPIIVSNRPMLKQDPMMATPDGLEKVTTPGDTVPISRTAKTISVSSPAADPAAQAPTAAELVAKAATPTPEKKDDMEPKAVTPPTPAAQPASAETPQKSPVGTPSPTAAPVPAEPPKPVNDPGTPVASTPASAPTDEQKPAASSDDVANQDDSESDTQLAPNQALEEAKRKEEEAQTARLAEQEKIVASRQYYLPMSTVEQRRGLDRVLLILAMVLILALVWADVVLDAGIIHVAGIHALTHFFH